MQASLSILRRVGATNLMLPALGFGTAPLGELYAKVDEAESQKTLKAAWDGGIRYYDTAPWYGRGLAERRLGTFLRAKSRREFLISTKVGRTLFEPSNPDTFDTAPWAGGLKLDVKFDYSYDGIMRSYEEALQRLGLDTIDALVIHDLDAAYHGENISRHLNDLQMSGMRALDKLKASGDIVAYGIGVNSIGDFERAAAEIDLDFALIAMPYTLLEQGSLHTSMADCVRRNISVIIGSPFASGILATGANSTANYAYVAAPQEIQEKTRQLEAICKAHGVSILAAALQFPMAHPAVVSIIPGATQASYVTQDIAAFETTIPDSFWSDIKAQGLVVADAPTP